MSRKILMNYNNRYRSSFLFNTLMTMLKVCIFIFFYWVCSISLTFFNRHLFRDYKFPLSITALHMAIKFIFAALIRWFLYKFCFCSYCTTLCGRHQNNDRERVNLTWPILWRKIAPTGITASLDISLSNWSLQYITISLYIMCKSTVIIYILIFGIIFGLERFRCSLIGVNLMHLDFFLLCLLPFFLVFVGQLHN
ncbi:unnamed protein product [Rotaria sordida]|uniref:Uncharacterized protein n=1 Tax=Rotaria sordida TaxID=392033 RepID=A0A814QT60_9BILA|nr:unnamed protein product [Rotaria sordida]CAF1123906.1 unnamed protein product [Rotaria sordida]CAF1131094.1 unnamed protein product [Rotaria sordida]